MVTKKELLEDDKRRAVEEEKMKKQSEKSLAEFERDWRARDEKRAKGLVKGDLGEFIKKMNSEGAKTLKIDQFRTWHLGTHRDWDENYGSPFVLDFDPEPDCEPTKILVRSLRNAGFTVKLETEQKQNCEYFTTADGYSSRSVPGIHSEHSIVVSW